MSNAPKLNKKTIRNPLSYWPETEKCFCNSGIMFKVCCMTKLAFLVPNDATAKDLKKKLLERFPELDKN